VREDLRLDSREWTPTHSFPLVGKWANTSRTVPGPGKEEPFPRVGETARRRKKKVRVMSSRNSRQECAPRRAALAPHHAAEHRSTSTLLPGELLHETRLEDVARLHLVGVNAQIGATLTYFSCQAYPTLVALVARARGLSSFLFFFFRDFILVRASATSKPLPAYFICTSG